MPPCPAAVPQATVPLPLPGKVLRESVPLVPMKELRERVPFPAPMKVLREKVPPSPATVSFEKVSSLSKNERELRRKSANCGIDSVRFTVMCAFPKEYVYVARENKTDTTEIALDTSAVALKPTYRREYTHNMIICGRSSSATMTKQNAE